VRGDSVFGRGDKNSSQILQRLAAEMAQNEALGIIVCKSKKRSVGAATSLSLAPHNGQRSQVKTALGTRPTVADSYQNDSVNAP
jgi:hypothetical protein